MNPQWSSGQQQNYQNYAQYPMGGPVQTRRNNQIVPQDRDGGLGAAISTAIGYLVLIWTVFLVNDFIFGGALNNFGVRPRETSTLWGILTAPLLHADYGHIVANSLPGALFAGLIAMSSKRLFWQVTLLITVVGGGLTWLVGGVNTVHIGASGLIYGWLAFLVVRGFVNRRVMQIILGVILASMYSGLIWGVLPTQMAVSWQMHLFGGLAGIWAAVMFKRGRARG
ncbi:MULTISPECIES: rhomboid family intramembrane serine protease [Corynebacterium]|uniref:Rhomboid family intramembrane serine protease n=1 Tax=Corynebacterium amycolatum TaxID=43765 RepID=A0AAW9SVF8_CORAY|nr:MULTISPECIES: rhomboid family intramembrane serine protease [Corynebacterium]MBC6762039.1 rhomboid family intramembrane serine protease [Corynebacterium sp. LK27]MCQ9172858.1 rhomboid family intramembrane serine protease [Corynebacterium amycolatum]MDK7111202.1 rhomboid family intramembrane serine protease [Corynebacterium amycolatum]MDK7146362.1 rhomboid family intramembrane serine protease [Corynebacterium amycolatum]MDK7237053.1 rhomboid family intramembrane serine protease [Corynebacter